PGGGSQDIEDRRGSSGGGGFRIPGGGLGLGGLVVVVILSLIFKQDFLGLLGGGSAGATGAADGPVQASPEEEQLKQFVGFVLDDAQTTWDRVVWASSSTKPTNCLSCSSSGDACTGPSAAPVAPADPPPSSPRKSCLKIRLRITTTTRPPRPNPPPGMRKPPPPELPRRSSISWLPPP